MSITEFLSRQVSTNSLTGAAERLQYVHQFLSRSVLTDSSTEAKGSQYVHQFLSSSRQKLIKVVMDPTSLTDDDDVGLHVLGCRVDILGQFN